MKFIYIIQPLPILITALLFGQEPNRLLRSNLFEIHNKVSSLSEFNMNFMPADTLPITDLGKGLWKSYEGGLYSNGKNERPSVHDSVGISIAKAIQPLDSLGLPNKTNGKIVLLSIGMSNATQEYSTFKLIADTFSLKNPKLVIIDGAQGGQTAAIIKDPNANFWQVVNQRLAQQKLNTSQVQVIWLKEANANPNMPFPKHAQDLKDDLKAIVKVLKSKYPNLKLLYLSSRIYGGYANTTLNPEPYAYESGFSVKWLIDEQIKGDTSLYYNGTGAKAPWLSWGPYLWAKGVTPRMDGLTWQFSDFTSDGTHPSNSGRLKVANLLLDFFSKDSSTVPWFLKPRVVSSSINPNLEVSEHQPIHSLANYPNPFLTETTISWTSTISAFTKLTIVDIFGNPVCTLLDEFINSGPHRFQFSNKMLTPGIYLYQLQMSGQTFGGKMILHK